MITDLKYQTIDDHYNYGSLSIKFVGGYIKTIAVPKGISDMEVFLINLVSDIKEVLNKEKNF